MSEFIDGLKSKTAGMAEQAKKKKAIIIIALIPLGLVLYNYVENDGKPAQIVKSNIASADRLHSNLESNLSQPYIEKLHAQNEAALARAKENNKSYMPSIAGMTTLSHAASKGSHQELSPEEDAEEQAAPPPPPKAKEEELIDSNPADDNPELSLPEVNAPKTPHEAQAPQSHNVSHIAIRNYISEKRYENLQKQMEVAASMDENHNQIMNGVAAIAVTGKNPTTITPIGSRDFSAGSDHSLGSMNSSNLSTGHFKTPVDGTTWRGHFTSQLDSREPMRVYGKIDSGPYKGSLVIGSFRTNGEAHKISIQFNEIVYRYEDDDGFVQTVSSRINAFAIDPSSGMPGFADYVNRHSLQKILIPLATSFANGLGQAISQSGSSSMMSASGGSFISQGTKNLQQQMLQAMGNSANQSSSVLQSLYGNVADTIAVNAGHSFMMVFDSSEDSQK